MLMTFASSNGNCIVDATICLQNEYGKEQAEEDARMIRPFSVLM